MMCPQRKIEKREKRREKKSYGVLKGLKEGVQLRLCGILKEREQMNERKKERERCLSFHKGLEE